MISIKILLLFIVGVTAENAYDKCIFFDNGSGFVKLSALVSNEKPVKIRMEVKAYNCDDISLTLSIGNKYKFMTPIRGSLIEINNEIDDYDINSPCNGLWHNVTLELHERFPLVHWNGEPFYRDARTYYDNLPRGETLHIGFHKYNKTNDKNTKLNNYNEPFEGSIRNFTIDGVVQSISTWQLNGTLTVGACPNDLILRTTEGLVKLNENVTFDSETLQITFELKITNCPECCSSSAIILSAFGSDSYFILEIVANRLYWKFNGGSYSSHHVLSSLGNYQLCDGKWHKIAVLQQGKDHKMIADDHSDSNNFGKPQQFTAPLYVGQHPYFKMLSAFEIRNGFKGCLRALRINGVVPEVWGNANLNEFSAIGSCCTDKVLDACH